MRGLWQAYSWCPAEDAKGFASSRRGKNSVLLLRSNEIHPVLDTISRSKCKELPKKSTVVEEETQDMLKKHVEDNRCRQSSSDCSEGHFTCHRFMPFFAKDGGVGELVWSLVDNACQSLFGYNLPTGEFLPPCSSAVSDCSSLNVSTHNKQHNSYSKTQSISDERVREAEVWWERENCRRVALVPSRGAPKPSMRPETLEELVGLGCEGSNKTLQFGVIDSAMHRSLAQHWGLEGHGSEFSGAVIIDAEQEFLHVLNGPADQDSLAQFVVDYSQDRLQKKLLSNTALSLYREDYFTEAQEESVGSRVYSSMKRLRDAHSSDNKKETAKEISDPDDLLSIRELTSAEYLNLTESNGHPLVVLHYSRSCTHCNAVSHTFLQVSAHLRRNQSNDAPIFGLDAPIFGLDAPIFARIDMSANTLPWHLNFGTLPTVVYFPRVRRNTRVFDPRLPFTESNFMRFVASQAAPPQRVGLALAGCNSQCVASLRSLLPSRVASATKALMQATKRLHRAGEALKREKQRKTSSPASPSGEETSEGNHLWLLLLEERKAKQTVESLRGNHQYLLTIQDWISTLGQDGLPVGSASAQMLHSLLQRTEL